MSGGVIKTSLFDNFDSWHHLNIRGSHHTTVWSAISHINNYCSQEERLRCIKFPPKSPRNILQTLQKKVKYHSKPPRFFQKSVFLTNLSEYTPMGGTDSDINLINFLPDDVGKSPGINNCLSGSSSYQGEEQQGQIGNNFILNSAQSPLQTSGNCSNWIWGQLLQTFDLIEKMFWVLIYKESSDLD